MWASKAVKIGYKWQVGNGKSIKFWEDIWFRNSPLDTQFWDLYFVSNQQNKTIFEIWDGHEMRGNFRRTFTEDMMIQWHELMEVARYISFSNEEDQLIWQYNSFGVYSSSSLYDVINFRGITHIYLPAIWKLKIPPRVQVFLWLFSHNKIMTRDNLRARGIPKPMECEMCSEFETVQHLIFECTMYRALWDLVEVVSDVHVSNYESIASNWLCNKKFMHFNVVFSAVLWGMWLNRNNLVFNKVTWINLKQV
jgi:hypothetical protein